MSSEEQETTVPTTTSDVPFIVGPGRVDDDGSEPVDGPIVEVCIIDGVSYTDWLYADPPNHQGVTDVYLWGCSLPVPATTAEVAAPAAPAVTRLPDTGVETLAIGFAGAAAIVFGMVARRVGRSRV